MQWLDSDTYYKKFNVNVPSDNGTQEIDCIIASTKGVFNIEIKSFGLNPENNNSDTRLWIDCNGQWKFEKNGREKILENPSGQIYRYHKCIESLLGVNEDEVIYILVLANKRLFLDYKYEDATYDVVKLDILLDYIEKKEMFLTESNVKEFGQIIDRIH